MASKSNQTPSQSGPGLKTGTAGTKVHKPASLGRGYNTSPNSSSRGKQGK